MSETTNEILTRVANIVGLSVNDAQESLAIVDALRGVEKPNGLIAFIRKHRDSVEFKGKTERLDILAQRYKLKELDDRLRESYRVGNKQAVAIAKKVSECRQFVEDNNADWVSVVVRDDAKKSRERYFGSDEIELLSKVGSVPVVIEYSRIHTLVEELSKVLKNQIRGNHLRMIRHEQVANKSVMNHAKSIARKM